MKTRCIDKLTPARPWDLIKYLSYVAYGLRGVLEYSAKYRDSKKTSNYNQLFKTLELWTRKNKWQRKFVSYWHCTPHGQCCVIQFSPRCTLAIGNAMLPSVAKYLRQARNSYRSTDTCGMWCIGRCKCLLSLSQYFLRDLYTCWHLLSLSVLFCSPNAA